MGLIPHVVDARHIAGYKIEICFDDGRKGVVDLSAYPSKGGVFAPLSDPEYFKKFFIDLNTLCWPNGADIAPERLYEKLVQMDWNRKGVQDHRLEFSSILMDAHSGEHRVG